jgi:transcriptional regulator with XRE-family HTH domain
MNKKITEQHFGEALRKLRRKKGYTMEQLAERAGMSKRMIGHYETHVKRPSLEKINKIAEALDTSIEELMANIDSTTKKKNSDLSYKIMKKVRIIEELPTRDQNTIFSLINALAEKNKLKKKKE